MVITRLIRRALPALLMASSVTLLSAGVFNWAPPENLALGSPTFEPGDPRLGMTPEPSGGPTASSLPTPTPDSTISQATDDPQPSFFTPQPTPLTPGSVVTGDASPTRIVIPSLGIDLPVIRGDTSYPLCNVAQYLDGFVNPGHPGTTYLYGHARAGMFLPLLEQSQIDDGAGMIGALVKLYTADSKLHMYQIDIVKRHATDLSLAYDLEVGQHRLIMQTSEGPHGTIPKLQVAAKPIGIFEAPGAEALPIPRPRVCH